MDRKPNAPRTYCPPLAPLPDNHPQRETRRPMSAKVRWDHARGTYDYGITNENAPRVLRAIYEDDAEDQSVPVSKWQAIGIVAVSVVGTCLWLVVAAYLVYGMLP